MWNTRKAVLAVAVFVAMGIGWHARTIAQENSGAGIITVFDHQKLDASFERALANGGSDIVWSHTSGAGTYNVDTHSRENGKAPCKPEGCSHKDFTAVVYVVSGSATLVVSGSTKSAADKFGGHPIQGGESYRVGKGDMYLVPPDTFHFYKDIEGPFRYLEVPVH